MSAHGARSVGFLTPMLESITQRRYLIPFNAARLPQQFTDVLVIGGGVAGLRAAIAAAEAGAEVLLLTKDTIGESNTWYAQGGIAAVLQPLDSHESHIHDTEVGGAGLCDDRAVRIVIEEGPKRVLELLEWGANFDKKPGIGNAHDLAFTLEGGHSFARIIHAYGDATNPKIATADGHAMAYRAGAALQDMEMVQFHPTTLYVAGASRALITEAVRGEGAYLVDRNGYRFMGDYHPSRELAPRDVVSRAIVDQIRKTHFTHVYLDVRHLPRQEFLERFPQLAILLQQFEIDPAKELIPIHPAAHYMIGGIDADEHGRSSLAGLYAVGEAGCSGLHGANRLGSNSLLEGLAFGARAGADAARGAKENHVKFPLKLDHKIPPSTKTELD